MLEAIEFISKLRQHLEFELHTDPNDFGNNPEESKSIAMLMDDFDRALNKTIDEMKTK